MKVKNTTPWLGFAAVAYLVTHLYRLTALPVFADEAIYIRWAQLIIDNWQRYLFFPMNDGKTPLFIWMLVPWQLVFGDQLWAARWVSVLGGLLQVGIVGWLLKSLGAKRTGQVFGMGLTALLPFWFFHHRMALMDGWLTVWLSLTLLGLIQIAKYLGATKSSWRQVMIWIMLTGVSWGLSLWTKLPAVLVAPLFVMTPLWPAKITWHKRFRIAAAVATAGLIGLVMFASLKLSPSFGQLFNRGSDFLYPLSDVFGGGIWKQTVPNIPTYFWYFLTYLTWPICLAAVAGLFSKTHQRTHHWLWWSAWGFLLPIMIMGRVVYPRYLFPASLFFTLGAALVLEDWWLVWIRQPKTLLFQAVRTVIIVGLVAQTIAFSVVFMASAWWWPNQLPMVSADRVQYLTEWSSGHGLTETVALIKELSSTHRVAVATEGYFGTLPDGLLLYFHRRAVTNLSLDGIGQPVVAIPAAFWQKTVGADQVLLVVNSHRLGMKLDPQTLLLNVCRPDNAPCLQVWDITNIRPN